MNTGNTRTRLYRTTGLLILLTLYMLAAPAQAANKYWSGTGTWNTGNVNWGTSPGGPYNTATFSSGDDAFFEGTGSFTITQSGNNAPNSITCSSGTYQTSNYGQNNNPTISFSGTSATITAIAGGTLSANLWIDAKVLMVGGDGTVNVYLPWSTQSPYGVTKNDASVLNLYCKRDDPGNQINGPIIINGGTLKLGTYGYPLIASASTVSIAAGGTLDVSAYASTYTLDNDATLSASGTGITIASNAAAINGGEIINLRSRPISLTFTPTGFSGDTTHPSLYISQGSLTLNNNTITVNNAAAAPLRGGVYRLIQVGDGSTGTISGAFTNAVPIITGAGIAPGASISVSVSSGNLILTVRQLGTVITIL